MAKESVISYKVYPNERLQKVLFHGKEMYPLYIQVIHGRRPIYFKSYFFDLLSQEKYAVHHIGGKKTPVRNEIIAKEESLINFLIERQKLSFNLDTFQKEYYYYSKDLLNLLDAGFKDYLVTFFEDQGQPELGLLVASARNTIISADLMHGFKSALAPPLFKLLIENTPYYGPPLLPIQNFIEKKGKQAFYTLSVYEWEEYRAEIYIVLTAQKVELQLIENEQIFCILSSFNLSTKYWRHPAAKVDKH